MMDEQIALWRLHLKNCRLIENYFNRRVNMPHEGEFIGE